MKIFHFAININQIIIFLTLHMMAPRMHTLNENRSMLNSRIFPFEKSKVIPGKKHEEVNLILFVCETLK
jgi:hypothetical protein